MTRPLHRIVATSLAVWFAVFTVEPGRVHSCPMHDGPTAGVSGDEHAHAGHHAGMAATSGPIQQSDTGRQSPAPGHPQSHQCTCPDAGCCSASVALAAVAVGMSPSGHVVPATRIETRIAAPVVRGHWVLPFATAPPTRLV